MNKSLLVGEKDHLDKATDGNAPYQEEDQRIIVVEKTAPILTS